MTTLPRKTVSLVLRHISSRISDIDRCDHIGRVVSLRAFAADVVVSALGDDPKSPDLVPVVRAHEAYREWIRFPGNRERSLPDESRLELALGFGSAVAPRVTVRTLRRVVDGKSAAQRSPRYESTLNRLCVEFCTGMTDVESLFDQEKLLYASRPDNSWQYIVEVLPPAYRRGAGEQVRTASQMIVDVIGRAPPGEPQIRLRNVRALAFFLARDFTAVEKELREAEQQLGFVQDPPLRMHLWAIIESNLARMEEGRSRIADAYKRMLKIVAGRPADLEPGAFWFHARRGCRIAAEHDRLDEYWDLVTRHAPPDELLFLGADPFRACKSYQAFLAAAARIFLEYGRAAEHDVLRARREVFLRSHAPEWRFF